MAMSITKDIWSSLLRRERRSFLLVFLALILVSFALSPMARAVDPPPDGGYPNDNTAEGDGTLFSLTGGTDNTAVGFNALFSNTGGSPYSWYGSYNTAIGSYALGSNITGFSNTATGAFALS